MLSFRISLGEHGLGLTLAPPHTTVKGFRSPMPDGGLNPSVVAGLQVGDRIVSIDDVAPRSQEEAVAFIKRARGSVRIDVLRVSK